MKKALVMSVGTGTGENADIVSPLVKSVEKSNPNYILFVCTEASEKNAYEIANRLTLSEKDEYEIAKISDPDDLQSCFVEIASSLRILSKKGFDDGAIEIDFTSGTKAMTSAIVLAGLSRDCGTIRYITGKRKNGVVISGTEKFVTFEPNLLKAYENMLRARDLIRNLRFDSARDLVSGINENILDEMGKKRRNALYQIAVAYGFWDKFEHEKVMGEIEKAKAASFTDLKEFLPDKRVTLRLIGISKSITKGEITWDIIADLYCNARRRFDEGKYDDALARIYRLTEMLAQMILKKNYGIDSSDVDLDKVPSHLHGAIKYLKNREGKIQIGLVKDYEILHELGDEIGKYYKENSKFRGVLNIRNGSILAHGLQPVSRKNCEKAFDHFVKMATIKNPEFGELCRLFTFPWRKT